MIGTTNSSLMGGGNQITAQLPLTADNWVRYLNSRKGAFPSASTYDSVDIGLTASADNNPSIESRITEILNYKSGGYSKLNEVVDIPEVNFKCLTTGSYLIQLGVFDGYRYGRAYTNRKLFVNDTQVEPIQTLDWDSYDLCQYIYRLCLEKGDVIKIKHAANSITMDNGDTLIWGDNQVCFYQPSSSTSKTWYIYYDVAVCAWGYQPVIDGYSITSMKPVSTSQNFKII